MEFSAQRIRGIYRGWAILESFKFITLFMFLLLPEFSRSILYQLIFMLFFISVYSFLKTFPYFKFCLGRSIFEEYEPRRLTYARYRNYLFLIMLLDVFPFLLFPQIILRVIYWRRNRKELGHV